MKLVTLLHHIQGYAAHILIHTSVKLVTVAKRYVHTARDILIHTSVKLVTRRSPRLYPAQSHFNPHEREARDFIIAIKNCELHILIHTSVKLVTFSQTPRVLPTIILIHTSVKLVTEPAVMRMSRITF